MEEKRSAISRGQKREVTDKQQVYQILDEAIVCHVAFIRDGYPVVLPLNYGRDGDELVLHGSTKSPFFASIAEADTISIAVTHLDGLVLGKSSYNHSVNYRSVVLFGKAQEITDEETKHKKMEKLVNHIIKNRYNIARKPSANEMKATMVLTFPIKEYSAKMRSGDPVVNPDDESLPVWSGVVPLSLQAGTPVADKHSSGIIPENEIMNYKRVLK